MNVKHCRICYGPDNDDLIAVQLVQDGFTIHDMIRAIVGISVTGDRRLPQNICLQCLERLKIAFALRQQCIDTHERLCEELDKENVTPPPECNSTILKEEPGDELQALQIARLEEEEPKNDSEYEAEEQIECVVLEQQHNEPWREDVHFVLVHSLSCCGCNMYFDNRYELRVHSAQVHRKQNSRTKYGSFQCAICYQSYADQSGLDRHLEDAEASATVYECLHCSKLFEDRKQLFEHLQQQNESQPTEMVEDVEIFTAPEEQSIDTTSAQEVKMEEVTSENDEEYLLSSDSNVEDDEYSIDISVGEETDVVADDEACEDSNAKSLHSPSTQRTRMCRISEKNLRVVSEDPTYMIVELLGQRCCCCAQLYNTEKQLIVHLSQQRTIARSDRYAKYTCEYCGKPFKYSLSFLSHKRLLEQRQFYLCRLCNKLFDSKARMLSHMLMSEEHALFFQVSREDISNRYDTVILPGMRCCCCKLYFEEKDKLFEHIQTAHRMRKGKLVSKGFQCEFCKRLFRSVALVESHLRYTKDASQYYCKLCDYQTFNLRRMELHLYSSLHRETVMPMQGVRLKALKNSLSIVPPVRYCCFENCKIPFHNVELLKQHVETEHLDELNKNKEAQTELMGKCSTTKRYHECDVCAQCFPSASALQYHTALSSRQDSICAVCGVRQRTRADLLVHERIHTGERPFACDICSKTFTSKTKLVAHLKSHGARDHRCDVCGAQFKRKENLTRHKHLRHGQATIPCEVCGKKFKTVATLNIHAAGHTGEKRFVCRFEGCEKRYITVADRRRHEMSVHTKERPHECAYCKAAFVRKRQLTIHERHHTGEKPHVCPTCGKGFYDTYPLKAHLQMGCSQVGSATALPT
uniref:Protein krueppel n=1 Tax=Anopheles farauti TaxID=69004 RepID=A0A182QDE9_9DIPT